MKYMEYMESKLFGNGRIWLKKIVYKNNNIGYIDRKPITKLVIANRFVLITIR
jgi:hypothetical protein